MHYFTIGGIFKNESHILKEWIDHYLYHGVDHIYLINDNSTDNFSSILQPYIENNYVTLYNCESNHKRLGLQSVKYNHYFQEILKDTVWFGILDLDEFLYSPVEVNITKILRQYEDANQLQINWVHYGSSGYKEQPDNVVNSFINRGEYNSIKNGPDGRYNSHKSIVKTDGNVILGIHSHQYNKNGTGINISFDAKNTPLLINHYAVQSKDFWTNIKMTRGDADSYYDSRGWNRNEKLFNDMDVNDILDERLKKQNNRI